MNKYCYTSLLASDDYLPGILGLYYSLSLTKPKYPFILIAVDSLSDFVFMQLEKYNIEYIKVKDIACYYDEQKENNRYFCTVNKIYALNLPYDKIFFIDGDSIILHNLDYVFEQTPPRANMAGLYGHENGIAGGYLLVKPDEKIFNSLISQFPFPKNTIDVNLLNQYYYNANWIELKHNNIYHNNKLDKYWFGEKLNTYEEIKKYLDLIITALLQLEKYDIQEKWYYTGKRSN